MRNKTILNNAIFCCSVTVICLGSSIMDCVASEGKDEFYPVDINRIPEVLNLVSSKVLDNYGRIKTWQGKAEGIMTYGRYRKVAFDLDVEKDLLYVDDYPAELIEDTNIEGGKRINTTDALKSQISIVSPDIYIHSQPVVGPGNKVLKRKAFRELHQKECSTCRSSLPFVFDPKSQLKQPLAIIQKSFPLIIKKAKGLGGNKNYDLIKKVDENIKNGITEYRVTEQLKLTLEPNDPNYLLMSSIFSSNKGYNIISQITTLYTTNESKIIQRRTWDYVLIDDIYVLSKTLTQSYSDTGKSTFYEEIAFNDIKINKPISDDVFSYKNLGLRNGDKFVDKIANKEYNYQDYNLVFVSDLPTPANGKQEAIPSKKTDVNEPNKP
ncbi:MAG: hypothetical protein ABSB91_02265 [Sedimentisphaerales bacterium]